MATRKGTEGQTTQWPQGKRQKDKQRSGHKERDRRTNNTVATRKGTEGQTTQWPQGKGQKDKQRSTDHYTLTHTHTK